MHVVIAGFGKEGQASLDYYLKLGAKVTVVDEQPIQPADLPVGVDSKTGPDCFRQLDQLQADLIIRSAGLAPYKLKTNAKIWSATNEFFEKCPSPIIGVTGSKGKGTTASLITSILRAAGKTVHLLGNIGVPALSQLEQIAKSDVVVYELSSFQLWDIEFSPQIAVILHIEPDHLDVHSSFEDYLAAKAGIVASQTVDDICLYHPSNGHSLAIARRQPYFTERSAKYGQDNKTSNIITVYNDGVNFISSNSNLICAVAELQLPGQHNIENAEAAISACLNFDPTLSGQVIAHGLANFSGLNHRLKYIATVNQVDYYDDSIATTPGSAIAAIASFSQPKVLLVGGSSKGADFSGLAKAVAEADIRQVLVYGAEMDKIATALEQAGVTNFSRYDTVTMQQLVQQAHRLARPGDAVVLSPACASFDMFKSYEDRGQQFIAAVESLGRESDATP